MYTETERTLRLTIQPTNKCNLACTYCYQTNKGFIDLPFIKIQRVLDKLFEHDNIYFNGFLRDEYENIIFDFIGGEATLNMSLINQTMSYFIKKCLETKNYLWLHSVSIWLETNGTTYFKEDVQNFIKKWHAKLELPITLDGSKALHDSCRVYHNGKGSYNDVEKAVKHYMKTYGKQPNTKITISPHNVHSMSDGLINMSKLGYVGCRISCTYNETWNDKDTATFEKELRKFYDYLLNNDKDFVLDPWSSKESYGQGIRSSSCGAYGNVLCIACDGKLFLCQSFSDICDMHGRPVLSIGDVEQGISDEGIKILDLIKKSNCKIQKCSDKCSDCICNSICEYCPAVDYAQNGSFENHTPHLFTGNCKNYSIAYKLFKEYESKKHRLKK